MRAYVLNGGFGFDHLKIEERDEPQVGPGDVKVRMTAASLNYRDLLIISGLYNPKQKLPLIPISDGCGVVEEVCEGVTAFQQGDRVIPLFNQSWMGGEPNLERLTQTMGSPLDGVMADYRVFKAQGLVKVPDMMRDVEAATLPCAGVTAWASLVTEGKITAGECVVVQGTGGVSLFALQFAKALGAQVIVTSSSESKLEKAKALGADFGINYKTTPQWSKAVRDITRGKGADHIIEVGGAGTLDQSLRAIKIGGNISIIGVLSGAATDVPLTRILMQHVRLQGITVGNRDDFETMLQAIELHTIKPVIDEKCFRFESLPQALQYMSSGGHMGKIVLDLT